MIRMCLVCFDVVHTMQHIYIFKNDNNNTVAVYDTRVSCVL